MPETGLRALKVALFLALAAATILVGVFYDRYEPVGPEVLLNADFSQGLDGWRLKGPAGAIALEDGGTVRLNANRPNTHVSLTQSIEDPRRFVLVRLSAEMRTEDVTAGQRNWQKARLIMSSFDGKGQWVPAPHHVNSLIGSHPWKRYEQVFRIIPEAGRIDVSAQLDRAMGTLWIREPSLRKVIERPAYSLLQAAFFGLWGLFLVWLLAPSVFGSGGRMAWRGMVLLSALLVLAGTLISGEQRREIEKDLLYGYESMAESSPLRRPSPADRAATGSTTAPGRTVASAEREVPAKAAVPSQGVVPGRERTRTIEVWERIRKAGKSGHFVLFALFGLSLAGAAPGGSRARLLLDVAMLGAATELLQFFIEDRMPLLGDWLIDMAGGGMGLAWMGLLGRWRRLPPA